MHTSSLERDDCVDLAPVRSPALRLGQSEPMVPGESQFLLFGQLLSLSYLSRLYGPPPGATPLGKVSAVYIGLFLCFGVVGTLFLPPLTLGLSRDLMLSEMQLARPLTAAFWANGLGLDFALQLWFFGNFSSLLERRHYQSTPFKYAATLICGALLIALQVRPPPSAPTAPHVSRPSRPDALRRVPSSPARP